MKKTLKILVTLLEAARRLARTRAAFHLRDASFSGEGLQDGVTAGLWERLGDRAYEGRGA